MPAIADLKHEYRAKALAAHELVSDETLTAAEMKERLDPLEVDIKALSAKIADEEYLAEKRKAFGPVAAEETAAEPETAAKSLGTQVVESDRYRGYVDAIKAGGGTRSSGPITVKATLTSAGITGTDVMPVQRQAGVLPILFNRLTVADLLPQGTTGAATVRYIKEITATNAASTVAEGGAKPEAALDWNTVDEPVRKIAVVLRVTDELLEDFEAFRSYIDGRLTLFVAQREEAQLLNGSGSGNDITGLMNRAGLTAAQAKGGDSIAVAVHKEITKVRVASYLDPDGIIFHPNDWEAATLEVDGESRFFGNGPFGPQQAPTYWGLPAVVTQAQTENTALVGAFRTAAQVFRRSGITVDMSNSDGNDFSYNRTALRAEERLALAVYRESAFGKVTGI